MQKFKTILTNPINPNNPFEFIGVNHNFLMSSIIKNFGNEIDGIADLEARQQFIKDKTNELTQYFYGFTSDLDSLNSVYGYNGLYSDADFENYQPIIENINIPTQDQFTLIEFYNKLTEIPLDNGNYVTQAIYMAYSLEMEIIKSDTTNNYNVLAATAVTRYSLFWGQTNLNPNDIAARKIKWGHAIADACGAIIGGVAGGVAGALGGAVAGTTIYDKCTEQT